MGLHLAIEIAEHAVRFVSLNNTSISDTSTLIYKSTVESEIQKEIDDFILTTSFLQQEFEEQTLSWSTKRSSLVPNSIFGESSAKSIYQLCFGKETTVNDIDYNRLAELGIVNVFDIPLWIKSYFIRKFPRINIQQQGSHALRAITGSNAFNLKLNLLLEKDYFNLTIVKHNKLEFYSFFDYNTFEDIIYHTLFALQQKELTNEVGTLEIIEGIGIDPSIVREFELAHERIKDLNSLKIIKSEHFMAKSQLLCV